MKNTSTYTFGLLKQNIYKVLGEYTLNGSSVSPGSGFMADIEKRFISTLNICMRRIALSMPALTSNAEVYFDGENTASLPDNFGKIISFEIPGKGKISEENIRISDRKLVLAVSDKLSTGILEYTVKPNVFTAETMEDERINLPDICADALVYLTASELCPAEYAELYNKLLYKYRDITANYYNAVPLSRHRNGFYSMAGRKSFPVGR